MDNSGCVSKSAHMGIYAHDEQSKIQRYLGEASGCWGDAGHIIREKMICKTIQIRRGLLNQRLADAHPVKRFILDLEDHSAILTILISIWPHQITLEALSCLKQTLIQRVGLCGTR